MSFINANILALYFILICLVLVKFNILKPVMIAMFLTGILQCLISGYTDFMAIAIMLGFFGVTTTTNQI